MILRQAEHLHYLAMSSFIGIDIYISGLSSFIPSLYLLEVFSSKVTIPLLALPENISRAFESLVLTVGSMFSAMQIPSLSPHFLPLVLGSSKNINCEFATPHSSNIFALVAVVHMPIRS